ncbi:matrix metalloproteinase-2-like [Anopheles coustani]|uniref:matrix metalloproteinase-2-like n=1 Tax=Anopheles coustani TaxID=139045 RepID=UPI002657F49B|nr:matrix metalloproteinase-2-like [Anopheles coustani]
MKNLQYFMQFGYISKSNIETGNLRTIEELENAVRRFQTYGGLEPTGKMDEATVALMEKPRCGAPDFNDSLDFSPSNEGTYLGRRRFRRYSVNEGPKWKESTVTWR